MATNTCYKTTIGDVDFVLTNVLTNSTSLQSMLPYKKGTVYDAKEHNWILFVEVHLIIIFIVPPLCPLMCQI